MMMMTMSLFHRRLIPAINIIMFSPLFCSRLLSCFDVNEVSCKVVRSSKIGRKDAQSNENVAVSIKLSLVLLTDTHAFPCLGFLGPTALRVLFCSVLIPISRPSFFFTNVHIVHTVASMDLLKIISLMYTGV